MSFSSVPLYLDPPNWQQQQQQQQQQQEQHHHHQQHHQQQQQTNHLHHHQPGGSSINTGNPQLPLSAPPPPQAAGGLGSIRPGSMADRARMAKIPQPEMALKCPRCESTNTKFCYFNNYSLTQPRHFCKTCRRYWTRGGALRNVPVGGGCRRNKRSSKSSGSSKSGATAGSAGTSTTSVDPTNSSTSSDMMMGHIQHQPSSQLPNFMASLHHQLISDHYGAADQLGFSYGGIHHHAMTPIVSSSGGLDMEFNMGISSSSAGDHNNSTTGAGGDNLSSSSRGSEQWRFQHLQQFPFMSGLEAPQGGLYPMDGEGGVEPSSYLGGSGTAGHGQINRAKPPSGLAMHGSQMPSSSSVKMEENQAATAAAAGGLNLSRQFLGSINPAGNDRHQYLGSNAWTNLSSAGNFTSSSTSHLL